MIKLSSARLTALLHAALPGSTERASPKAPKPVLLKVPDVGLVRVYLWTVTPDQSKKGRPAGEHKIQIILPGTPRGSRQVLDIGDCPTFLMGYSPLYGVFVFWEAERHQNSAYSANLQVQADLLDEAAQGGWAIDEVRKTDRGPEVRAAVHPFHVKRFIQASVKADSQGLEGDQRAALLIAHAPEWDGIDLENKPLPVVRRARTEARGTRLKRAADFSKRVLHEFGHRCAVCEVQLSLLDGAHIIPVHHPNGSDEVWNGLALCVNHHRLFDRRIILIDEQAYVRADQGTLDMLKALGKFGGYEEIIGVFRNKPLRKFPDFYSRDRKMRRLMEQALATNFNISPTD